jgi:hypothetical protein
VGTCPARLREALRRERRERTGVETFGEPRLELQLLGALAEEIFDDASPAELVHEQPERPTRLGEIARPMLRPGTKGPPLFESERQPPGFEPGVRGLRPGKERGLSLGPEEHAGGGLLSAGG